MDNGFGMGSASNAHRDLCAYPHRYVVQTRRSDSLSGGHIPNRALADYADDAREAMHLAIMGGGLFDAGTPSLVLGATAMRFLKEVTYPGSLTIGVGIASIGAKSLREVFAFFRDGQCMVVGGCTMVRLGPDRRTAPFADDERRRAAAFVIKPQDRPPIASL